MNLSFSLRKTIYKYIYLFLLKTYNLFVFISAIVIALTVSGFELDASWSLLASILPSDIQREDVWISTCNTIAMDMAILPLLKKAKVIFMELLLDRRKINLETKNKTGIYCWVNKTNGNTYVGSGHSLYKRISNYYQPSYYKREANLLIIKAINKHGLDNFALIILEYTNERSLIEREQYWIDKIEPAYNMIKKAGIIFSSDEHRKKNRS